MSDTSEGCKTPDLPIVEMISFHRANPQAKPETLMAKAFDLVAPYRYETGGYRMVSWDDAAMILGGKERAEEVRKHAIFGQQPFSTNGSFVDACYWWNIGEALMRYAVFGSLKKEK